MIFQFYGSFPVYSESALYNFIVLQGGPQNYNYFSLLIFSKKIITDSLFSGILQARPVEVVWHQDGCCSPIFSARKVKHFGKLLFNKISGRNLERISKGIFWEKGAMQEDDNKDCREI